MTLDNWQQWEGRIVGGRYALRQYLGGSDHSAVYLTDFGGAQAVVKLVAADAPDGQAQFARWEAACTLAHPNLLRVYDTGRWHADDEQDMFFAVMEYGDENLGEVLSQRSLSSTETREMLTPTLAALEYLHGRNLVHGCLKPSNVLAVGPQLKLAVDGVRRAGTRLTSAEQEDPRSVPEVFNAGVSGRNDIWRLGLLLVESLTRQQQKSERSGNGVTQLPDEIVEPFRSITQACLQSDPVKRCSIPEIRHMLERPDEVLRPAAEVVPIRPEPDLDAKLPMTQTAEQPAEASGKEKPAGPEALKTDAAKSVVVSSQQRTANVLSHAEHLREPKPSQKADETYLLEDEAAAKQTNKKLIFFAIAAVVAILAIFALVRIFGHHAEVQPDAVATEQSTNSSAAQAPAPVSAKAPTPASPGVAHQVMPEVTRSAQNSIHGVVKVRVKVNVSDSGQVTLAGLTTHGPSRYFAKQALEAARQWTFTPPAIDGKPVASRWSIEFDFRRSGVKTESRMLQPKA